MIFQIILLYASFAVVDVMDKFLISKRKIRPLSYAFFSLVTGAALLVIWPWVFEQLPLKFIGLDLLSGAYYALFLYVYFRTLSYGEVSRVVPVVFSLVPVFDVFISFAVKRQSLTAHEVAAMFLLIPGALLIAYYPGKKFFGHFGLKVLSAFLISTYNWLWQYGAQIGGSLNNLMWNRIGASVTMLALLAVPLARRNIFKVEHVPKKRHTGILFVVKQLLGGLNFIVLSYFLAVGKIPVVDGLSAFRYAFLFLFALVLSFYFKQVLDEAVDRKTIKLKLAALVLIFAGTWVLFL